MTTAFGSHQTTFERFAELATSHAIVPVVRRLLGDSETPMGVYRKLADERPGTFLLESADSAGEWGRFSFVGASSYGTLSTDGAGRPVWQPADLGAETVDEARAFGGEVPDRAFDAIQTVTRRWRTARVPGVPPLTSGLIGYVSWEAVRELERLPEPRAVETPAAAVSLSFVRDLVAIDHRYGTVWLVHNALIDQGRDLAEIWAQSQQALDALVASLAKPTPASLDEIDFDVQAMPRHRTAKADFLESVEVAKRHIRAGDVFQVVISQRFDIDSAARPLDIYRVLRTLNPSPYMYLQTHLGVNGEPVHVVGSSPEALVKVSDGAVVSHPIAGSRPRGASPERDQALAEELLADEKERSEHLMLVDLARNDLLKVCEPTSVRVSEFMIIERFSHIMHISSSVEGRTRDGIDAVDVLAATFPAGTLSGAPKPRALEIITEQEPSTRGVYGGVVGYFDFAGNADLAIAIRTAVVSGGTVSVQAGAGLVADSVPETEYQESVNKAAAPLRAAAIAGTIRRAGADE
ncbi:chorismate-binding protein [Pseudoclavibacter soli]|uniref:chorismate-binding protein n=1 Tax=Pseudoclavibacter soli TaxID=452623 RepID=UPI00040872BB|nr:chorismate-binding protein [Pseudoclavibacter soli]